MQLTIVRGHAGRLEDPVLCAMFEARKRVFVDLLKWDVPVLAGRYEIDQFDDEHATYLVLAGRDGAHLASARLLETDRPHILDSLFPDLCEEDVPCGRDVREITRFCLDRRLTTQARSGVRDTLVHALARHAIAQGITSYTGVAEMSWLQQILAFGWDCEPLGLPRYHGSTMLGALRIAITPDTPSLLANAGLADLVTVPPLPRRLAA